jgi:hypothetical protein
MHANSAAVSSARLPRAAQKHHRPPPLSVPRSVRFTEDAVRHPSRNSTAFVSLPSPVHIASVSHGSHRKRAHADDSAAGLGTKRPRVECEGTRQDAAAAAAVDASLDAEVAAAAHAVPPSEVSRSGPSPALFVECPPNMQPHLYRVSVIKAYGDTKRFPIGCYLHMRNMLFQSHVVRVLDMYSSTRHQHVDSFVVAKDLLACAWSPGVDRMYEFMYTVDATGKQLLPYIGHQTAAGQREGPVTLGPVQDYGGKTRRTVVLTLSGVLQLAEYLERHPRPSQVEFRRWLLLDLAQHMSLEEDPIPPPQVSVNDSSSSHQMEWISQDPALHSEGARPLYSPPLEPQDPVPEDEDFQWFDMPEPLPLLREPGEGSLF